MRCRQPTSKVRRQLAGIARNAGLHDEEGSEMPLPQSVGSGPCEGSALFWFFCMCVYVSVYHGAEAGFGNLGVSRLFRFQDFNLNIRFS